MRSICVINNYNYAKYLAECIDSALRQVAPFDKILIIDDGSTDNSRDVIEKYARENTTIQTIFKENKGQLSCFNMAAQHIEADDFVFLLDSDDVFPPDYTQLMLEQKALHPADLYFCEPGKFQTEHCPLSTSKTGIKEMDFTWEISSYTIRMRQSWVGSPTSCVSLTGALYKKLLPYTHEDEWRTRADDIIIFGSSLVGATKRYVPSLTIGYRVHQTNAYYGRKFSGAYEIRRQLYIDRFLNLMCITHSLSTLPSTLGLYAVSSGT
jgi:glycosyltransferase involved in cell wall biosynthesis